MLLLPPLPELIQYYYGYRNILKQARILLLLNTHEQNSLMITFVRTSQVIMLYKKLPKRW